jgi:hypothetical protein
VGGVCVYCFLVILLFGLFVGGAHLGSRIVCVCFKCQLNLEKTSKRYLRKGFLRRDLPCFKASTLAFFFVFVQRKKTWKGLCWLVLHYLSCHDFCPNESTQETYSYLSSARSWRYVHWMWAGKGDLQRIPSLGFLGIYMR